MLLKQDYTLSVERLTKMCNLVFHSNVLNQRGNIEKRDVGDSPGVTSKLNDMQDAIESLTHSVNNVATKQQVRMKIIELLYYTKMAYN